MNLKNILIISTLSLITYLLSISFVIFFPKYNLIWISFYFWIFSVIALPVFVVFKKRASINFSKELIKKHSKNEALLLILIVISIIFSFIFLKSYPFVALGDEIRDGGLNAFQIASGQIKNIYDYGRYQSHGLIIPTISSFFYLIFHNSVLTYRFPSAIISILTIIIVYSTLRITSNKRAGFFAGLILITSHFFLFYMRTEIVIAFTGLLTALIIFAFSIYKKFDKIEYYALLGLVLGFSSGFHASARTIVFITLIIFITYELLKLIKHKKIKKQLTGFSLLIFYYIIGFGPKILYTTPEIFFHTRTITALNQTSTSPSINQTNYLEIISGLNPGLIINQYLNSFHMFFDKPLVTIPFHYESPEILFPVIISLFIFFGILSTFILKTNGFFKYLIFYFLMIPLINSSLTDCYQCNYRLLPLIIVSSIFAGLGIEGVLSIFKKYSNQIILLIGFVISIYLVFQGIIFFQNNLGSIGKTSQDYLSMHAIYFIKNDNQFKNSQNICLMVSTDNYKYLNLLHIQEQYQYFLPKKYLYVFENPEIKDKEFYINNNCTNISKNTKFTEYKICTEKNKFECIPSDTYSLYLNSIDDRAIKINPGLNEEYNYFIVPPIDSPIP